MHIHIHPRESTAKGPATRTQEDPNLVARVDKLEKMTEEQVQQTTLLTKLIEETKEMVETSTANLERCVENACAAIWEIPAQQPSPAPTQKSSGAAKEGLSRLHAKVLARSKVKEREVVIKCDLPSIMELSEKEIVAKANLALEPTDEEDPRPENMNCLSICRARESLIILELDCQESVQWLHLPRNKYNFLQRFRTDITVIEHSFKVLAEFIPVTLDTTNPTTLRSVEQYSHINPTSIVAINWIKNPNHRRKDQKVVHAMLQTHINFPRFLPIFPDFLE
jgi:hypothetical protein